ncbi:MAG: LuxR C-terminal-related transcriptional regulator [Planctomycetota bacterium]
MRRHAPRQLPLNIVGRLLRLTVKLMDGPPDTGWQLRTIANELADLDAVKPPNSAKAKPDVVCITLTPDRMIEASGIPVEDRASGSGRLHDRLAERPGWLKRVMRVTVARAGRPVVVPLIDLTRQEDDRASWMGSTMINDDRVFLTLMHARTPTGQTAPPLRAVHAHTAKLITTGKVSPNLRPRLGLTLDELLTGKSEAEIAEAVHRSPHTVHANVKEIYRIFGVTSRAALMAKFIGRRQPRRQ